MPQAHFVRLRCDFRILGPGIRKPEMRFDFLVRFTATERSFTGTHRFIGYLVECIFEYFLC